MALWRIVDDGDSDDDDVLTSSVAGLQSHTHWPATSYTSSDDDHDDEVGDNSDSEPMVKRPATTTQCRRRNRPLRVPSYYRMNPVSVKMCEKAEKVRAFAYNDFRQVITTSSLPSYRHRNLFLSLTRHVTVIIINIIIVISLCCVEHSNSEKNIPIRFSETNRFFQFDSAHHCCIGYYCLLFLHIPRDIIQ